MKKTLIALLAAITAIPGTLASGGYDPDDNLIYEQTFLASAYYSPLPPDQQGYYLRGNYDSERVLNGNGTNGASGKEVFTGMIAAPRNFPFGTKIYIPGIGLGEVQDRGGAIVSAEDKLARHAHDRLDIWMGQGEPGLARALTWGKREKYCTVYLPGAEIPDAILNNKFENSFLFADAELPETVIARLKYGSSFQTLKLGDQNEAVRTLQQNLQTLGYLDDFTPTAYFGPQTERALIAFQIRSGIVNSADGYGAGYFGAQTAGKMAAALGGTTVAAADDDDITQEDLDNDAVDLASNDDAPAIGGPVLAFVEDLSLGSKGAAVMDLQAALRELGYFNYDLTDYYGMLTTDAVYNFQKENNIVASKEDMGSGVFGPQTRAKLTEILAAIDAGNDDGYRTRDEVVLGEAFAAAN